LPGGALARLPQQALFHELAERFGFAELAGEPERMRFIEDLLDAGADLSYEALREKLSY